MKTIVATPGDRQISLVRTFDAPKKLVFEAWTKPELLKRWLGVREGWTLDVCTIDLKVGGASRYVWKHPKKGEMGMTQTTKEVVPNEKIVNTEAFDDPWYEGEASSVTTFVESQGKTTVTNVMTYATKEMRDQVANSGMEHGVDQSYDVLDEIFAA